MTTTRRGFIGRLIAAVAAAAGMTGAAVAKAPVDIMKPIKESSLSKVASDFDGGRIVVQPRYRHIMNPPIVMAPTFHTPY